MPSVARNEGQETVTTQLELSDLRRSWIEAAIPRVRMFFDGQEFTADDLHRVLERPEQRNWFGVLMATLKNRGLIVETGYIVSTRPERNRACVLKWRMI